MKQTKILRIVLDFSLILNIKIHLVLILHVNSQFAFILSQGYLLFFFENKIKNFK